MPIILIQKKLERIRVDGFCTLARTVLLETDFLHRGSHQKVQPVLSEHEDGNPYRYCPYNKNDKNKGTMIITVLLDIDFLHRGSH